MSILCINGKYLSCLEELREILERTSELGNISTNEILASVRDGAVTNWLKDGNEKERRMAEKLSKRELAHDKMKDHMLLNYVKSIICEKQVESIEGLGRDISISEFKYRGIDGKCKETKDNRIYDYGEGIAILSFGLKSKKAINIDVCIKLDITSREGEVHKELIENMDMSESDEKAYLVSFSFELIKDIEYELILSSGQYQLATYTLINKPSINGHVYIDLGLPSGTMWATCNIGAFNPEDKGCYFAWGETEPKKECDNQSYKSTFYNKDKLNDKNDVAVLKWGRGWKVPSREIFIELITYCIWEWTSYNGVNGYLIKSRTNDKYIFLPAVGCQHKEKIVDKLSDDREWGIYWISDFATKNTEALSLFFQRDRYDLIKYEKSYGLPVRAVYLKKD